MKEKHLQHVSSLLDGELRSEDSKQTIETLYGEGQAGKKLDRYALIGSALRDETVVVYEEGFLKKIQKAIEEEPAVLAPIHVKRANNKPYVGVALAASFAFISMILFNVFPGPSNTDNLAPYAEGVQEEQTQVAFEDEPNNVELEKYLNAQRDAEQHLRPETRLVDFEK
jgi:hypothetical protein